MAAFKSFINKIDVNLAGQCCLIRDQEGGIGADMASQFPRNTSEMWHRRLWFIHVSVDSLLAD